MQAAVFNAPGRKLSIETLPDPVPGSGQIVLKVGRCGICGSDIHMTESHEVLPAGSVLGHEFAGEIAAVGAGVQGLKIGDRVTALPMSGCGSCASCLCGQPKWCRHFQWRAGGYAEYVLADATSCLKLPDILSLADGALVEPMAVARHAVQLADFAPGANVLVLGAGPIGLAAVYWAKRFGAGRIVVTAASGRREALAATMGADHFVINDGNAAESVTALLGGLPEVVIECVGLPGMIARSVEFARPRGTVVVAGACVGLDQFAPMAAMIKELRMLFAIMYGIGDFQASIDAMDEGGVEIRAMVTDTVGVADFPDAFESLRSRNLQCKVLFSPSDS